MTLWIVLAFVLGAFVGRWVEWYGAQSVKPTSSRVPIRRPEAVSASNLIGLPSRYFADEELLGSHVRLLSTQYLGGGFELSKFEMFVVSGIALQTETRGRVTRKCRLLLLTSHRARQVPVKDCVCELVLDWPQKVQGNPNER